VGSKQLKDQNICPRYHNVSLLYVICIRKYCGNLITKHSPYFDTVSPACFWNRPAFSSGSPCWLVRPDLTQPSDLITVTWLILVAGALAGWDSTWWGSVWEGALPTWLRRDLSREQINGSHLIFTLNLANQLKLSHNTEYIGSEMKWSALQMNVLYSVIVSISLSL